MKKLLIGILAVLAAGTIFTSFSPSVDGRAVVADKDELPSGLFAKTIGYLPGDTISVTNLSKKTTVDVLVVGSVENSEGIAILLTPEAASALGMEKGGNNVVKITKRAGSFDEAIKGTAVIGANITEDAEESSEDADVPSVEGESAAAKPAETAAETPAASENAESEVPASAESAASSEAPAETASDASAVPEKVPAEAAAEVIPAENLPFTAPEAEAVVPEAVEPIEAVEAAEGEKLPETITATEEAEEAEDVVENEKVEEETEESEETVPAVNPVEDDDEAVAEKPFDEESEPVTEEEPEEIKEPETAKVDEDELEEIETGSENSEAVSLKTVVTEITEEDTDDEEGYEPIVLIPSTANPPESLVPAEETEAVENTEAVKTPAAKTEKPASNVKDYSYLIEKHTVNSLSELKSGKYYVQIAALSDKNNINELYKKYGGLYPITFVKMPNGKTLQVLVGPLSVDEYGTVLTRFKSYGFKDAFLRKIK